MDPLPASQAEGGGGEFGQHAEPQVFEIQLELDREAGDDLVFDPGAVVLDVPEQGRLGGDQWGPKYAALDIWPAASGPAA